MSSIDHSVDHDQLQQLVDEMLKLQETATAQTGQRLRPILANISDRLSTVETQLASFHMGASPKPSCDDQAGATAWLLELLNQQEPNMPAIVAELGVLSRATDGYLEMVVVDPLEADPELQVELTRFLDSPIVAQDIALHEIRQPVLSLDSTVLYLSCGPDQGWRQYFWFTNARIHRRFLEEFGQLSR